MKQDYEGITSTLVVLSGGQDSTTCLFNAIHTHQLIHIGAVSFDYDQRHKIELQSAAFIYHLAREEDLLSSSNRSEPYRWVLKIPPLHGESPLTDKSKSLEQYSSFDQMQSVIGDRRELTYVPNRNMIFLSFAANIAIAHGFQSLTIGVSSEDNANYDDCREDFIVLAEDAVRSGTGVKDFHIVAPLIHKTKKETVELAKLLPGCWEALAFSHTDYEGKFPPGNNHASVLRAEGFRQALQRDPLLERAAFESGT